MNAASGPALAPKRGAHTVVLGCAKAERAVMAPLVEAFAAQEHHVELVSGVDESRQRWREAGQRCGLRAVYVACGGPMLPPTELAALRDELLSIGIPATSIVAAVVDWSQVDRLIRDVERMMQAAPVVVPAPPRLSSVREVGPSVGAPVAAASIAPMLPPTRSSRLAPVGPSPMSLAPERVPDHASGSLDPVDATIRSRARARRWAALVVGTAALVGVGLWAGLRSTEDDGTATAAASESVVSQPPSAPSKGAKGARAKAPSTPASSAKGPSPTPDEPIDVSDHEPADHEPAAEATPLEPSDHEPAAELPADDDALVHAALMQRKIRALDILLVSPEATSQRKKQRPRVRRMHWEAAKAYCDALDIEGVKGWRLPTVGEFRTLSTSNMLERRSYWSATEGDAFGSDRVVWNNLKKTMGPAPAAWKDGRVLCVRFQHPESFPPP